MPRIYRWNKTKNEKPSTCEKCIAEIPAVEECWERTGCLSFNEYESVKDDLDKIYFHTFHFVPPEGKIIQDKKTRKFDKKYNKNLI